LRNTKNIGISLAQLKQQYIHSPFQILIMHNETPQTGLLQRAKMAMKTWRIDDLDGFARPADMPMDTYKELRQLKNMEFERRKMPTRIWISVRPIYDQNFKFTGFQKVQGTYRMAIHGQIGSRNKTV
jgi:hypothetical protein